MDKQGKNVSQGKGRRDFVYGMAAAGASLFSTQLVAGGKAKQDHHHHHANRYEAVLASVLACLKESELCNAHCIELIKHGDNSIVNCMQSVMEMIPVCEALSSLAAYQSDIVPQMAKLGIDVMARCEKECRKHEKHAQCKACADACQHCIKVCKKVV